MTTRVNKGGTVFRPVAKAKSRGPSVLSNVSRQASIISDIAPIHDASASNESASQSLGPSRSMAPPSIALSESISSSTQHVTPQGSSSMNHFSVPPAGPMASSCTTPAPPRPIPVPVPPPPRPSNVIPSLAVNQHPSRVTNVPPLVTSSTPGNAVNVPSTPIPPIVSVGTPIATPKVAPSAPATSQTTSSVRNALEEFATNALHIHSSHVSATVASPVEAVSTTHQVDANGIPSAITTNADQNTERPEGNETKRKPSRGNPSTASDANFKGNVMESAKKKRKTSRKSVTPMESAEGESTTPRRRRRKSSSSDNDTSLTRRRRARSPSLPRFDPDENPGEELDPTVVTMAALCSDTGQGRISSKAVEIQSNYAAWKTQSKQQRARMKELAELKKYGRATEEGEGGSSSNRAASDGPSTSAEPIASTSTLGAGEGTDNGFDYTHDLPTNRYNVQVRIGPNGETIIDEDSLVVDREPEVDTSDYTHIVESDTTKFVNSGTYQKKNRGSRWSKEETELFYHALSQYGENYELLAFVLPGRDRTACKNKFKAEDKRNPDRITYCLNNRIPVDISTLSRMTGKDFSGPCPEIRMPPPKQTLPAPTISNENEEAAPPKQQTKPKKRSRSRSMALTDDVQIIGNVDTFEQTDD